MVTEALQGLNFWLLELIVMGRTYRVNVSKPKSKPLRCLMNGDIYLNRRACSWPTAINLSKSRDGFQGRSSLQCHWTSCTRFILTHPYCLDCLLGSTPDQSICLTL